MGTPDPAAAVPEAEDGREALIQNLTAALEYSNNAREIMRTEKEHGWREAEKWEAKYDALLSAVPARDDERERLAALHSAWNAGYSTGWEDADAGRAGRGFDGLAEKVDGGWLYRCDGMPTMMGCGSELVITRRFSRVGVKSTGWLVCYGECFPDEKADDAQGHDLDVVLTFCPSCRAHVEAFPAASPVTAETNNAEEAK